MCSAKVLARLMWGLSYQKVENTFVFIERSYVRPNPFDGERSDRIVIGLRKPPKLLLRRLKSNLGPSLKNIRWHTFGLSEEQRNHPRERFLYTFPPLFWVKRLQGTLCLYGTAKEMRRESAAIFRLTTHPAYRSWEHMDYHYIGEYENIPGEVQIFHDYKKRLWEAQKARSLMPECIKKNTPASQRVWVQQKAMAFREKRIFAKAKDDE